MYHYPLQYITESCNILPMSSSTHHYNSNAPEVTSLRVCSRVASW